MTAPNPATSSPGVLDSGQLEDPPEYLAALAGLEGGLIAGGRDELDEHDNLTHAGYWGLLVHKVGEEKALRLAGFAGEELARHKAHARPRRIRLTSESELSNIQPPAWLIDGCVPEQALGLIYGASETFKSFVALYLAMCVAAGLEVNGLRTKPGHVIYVAAEGFFGLLKRYNAFVRYHGLRGPLGTIHFLRHGIEVRKGSDDIRELRDEIRDRAGPAVQMIVLDTLNRNYTGNENAAEDMLAYVHGCDELREATGAAVLSIHHTGHIESERSRGHSSLRAALDVEMKCTRDGDRVSIECTKMKDAPHFQTLAFDMVPAAGSLVPKAVGSADVKMTPNRATALDVLPTEGGLTRKEWQSRSELKPGSFRHALDWHMAMAYARRTHEAKYVRTESGTAALCQPCQPGATALPSVAGAVPATRGGI